MDWAHDNHVLVKPVELVYYDRAMGSDQHLSLKTATAGLSARWSLAVLLVVFTTALFAAMLVIGHRAALRTERIINAQQAALTRLAAQDLRDRIDALRAEGSLLARHDLQAFALGRNDIGRVAERFQNGLAAHPDILAYTLVDSAGELIYARGIETPAGEFGVDLALRLFKQYADRIATFPEDLFVAPPVITREHQVLGLIFPVRIQDEPALVLIVDLKPVAQRLASALSLGQRAYLVDGRGQIIHHPDPSLIGRRLEEAPAEAPFIPLPRVPDQPVGSDRFPVPASTSGGRYSLVAWDTLWVGGEKLTVMISTPESAVKSLSRGLAETAQPATGAAPRG